jgi:predicted nucleic acid-binding protein
MPNVISNTSCLIALSNIGMLDLLQQRYGGIVITPEVEREFGEVLPDWITVVPVQDVYRTLLINSHLDLGESSTIALAGEMADPLVILDDGKARRYAKSIGLTMTGTLGIIRKGYEMGLIPDIVEVITALRIVNFRVPSKFEEGLFA